MSPVLREIVTDMHFSRLKTKIHYTINFKSYDLETDNKNLTVKK
jgi:hypothetical protein